MGLKNRISSGEVHIWRISLKASQSLVETLIPLLSLDETKKASSFQLEEHMSRFIIGRAAVRSILGEYLDQSPETLQFEYGKFGKPEIPGQPLKFNFSNSFLFGVCAVGFFKSIGVDVERMREVEGADRIVAQQFTSAEKEFYFSLPLSKRKSAFLESITQKEACLKASGIGLSQGLSTTETNSFEKYYLYKFRPKVNYVGTLATDQECPLVIFKNWSP